MKKEPLEYKWCFNLNLKDIISLESCLEKEKDVYDGDIILKKGGFNKYLIILDKGLAQHVRYNKDNEEKGVRPIYSPSVLCGIESLVERGRKKKIHKTIKMLEKGKVVYLNNERLSDLIKNNSEVRMEIIKSITPIMRSTYRDIETMSIGYFNQEHKFGRYILDFSEEKGWIKNGKVSLYLHSFEKLSQIVNISQDKIRKYLKTFSKKGLIAIENLESEEAIKHFLLDVAVGSGWVKEGELGSWEMPSLNEIADMTYIPQKKIKKAFNLLSSKKLNGPFLLTIPNYSYYKRCFDK